ncbi:MAG: NfeD family protein [Ahrensia sp.]|nr:NfeD family protein [Ahrensia sp.]
MIVQIFTELGPWTWFIVGLMLLIGEIFLPGVFLIWFGVAAITIGTLTLAPFTDVAWWPWQVQLVAFVVLSLLLVLIGRRIFPSGAVEPGTQGLNDRLGQLVGHETVLLDAIENGRGRVRLGDTVWRVKGDDLPVGQRVRVTGSEDGLLLVVAI